MAAAGRLRALVAGALGEETLPDADVERARREALVLGSLAIVVLSFAWVGTYAALGLWLSAAIPFGYQVFTVACLASSVHRRHYAAYRTAQLGLMLLLPFVLQWSLGGFVASSAVGLWALVSPFGALVFQGADEALPWFGAFLVLVALSAGIDPVLPSHADAIPAWVAVAFFALNVSAVSLTAFGFVQYLVRARERAHRLLAAERERSEQLLLNILPEPIAARLKRERGVIAERREEVSVLFADLSGFTPAVERLAPERVVELLDGVFSIFDDLVALYGLEKIKTLGDGYLVAGGIPTALPDHAERIAELALAMRDALASGRAADGLALRIGVDTGPVVAGVIGRTKFSYDLWGDTVNTASRMESHAAPGSIQVTERTYRRLAGRYEFGPAERIAVKGKGTMTTYVLLRRRPVSTEPEPAAAIV